MAIWIGTSGFTYDDWEGGVFYPKDLPKAKQLEYYCTRFDTVELNVTFYRLPQRTTFEGWARRSPANFRFVLKGSRFITHVKRLKECREPLALFFEHARPLLSKTACLLWQLPPRFGCDLTRLAAFLKLLRRRGGPARLAPACHAWRSMAGRSRACDDGRGEARVAGGLRHAFEFRHESWLVPEVFEMIREAGMSVCRADRPTFSIEVPEMPFEYVRRHGPQEGSLYAGCYSEEQLRRDAAMIRRWARMDRDVFVYFNNDRQGYAAMNAMRLRELVGHRRSRRSSS